ncbi:SIMPL domain-containing protein [Catenulispora yoronensis]|uniref:SIMPL domain-containing protein n=1 Tax=Catenulispora yoronensis TaxID=450799 RepID=A0ABP5G122_9ACTN
MTQSIKKPWGISVFGAASVDAAPDLARLRLACNQTEPTPAAAFAATRAATTAIREALRDRGVADAGISSSRLNLSTAWRYQEGTRIQAGYDCSVSFVIEIRDLDSLEQVLIDAVAAGANSVEAVEFDVSTKKELRAKARAKAVAAAREKGALYAEAAGVELGPVVHIEDVDSDALVNTYRSHTRDSAGGDAESNLTPGRITVQAAVHLGFALAGAVVTDF